MHQHHRQDRQTDNGPIAQGKPFYKPSPKNAWTFWFGLTSFGILNEADVWNEFAGWISEE